MDNQPLRPRPINKLIDLFSNWKFLLFLAVVLGAVSEGTAVEFAKHIMALGGVVQG